MNKQMHVYRAIEKSQDLIHELSFLTDEERFKYIRETGDCVDFLKGLIVKGQPKDYEVTS